ncbi:MAG: choice-of-anchor Q domain-containing protein [Verrucomicrobiia bacterium]
MILSFFFCLNLKSATLTVLNNADAGAGSLRDTIAAAASGDIIVFTNTLNGQTITLTTGQITIPTNLTINGLGATNLTISGNGMFRIFNTAVGNTNIISNLKLAQGRAVASGGAIFNTGSGLIVSNVIFEGNVAAAFGGGIRHVNASILNVIGCTFVSNTCGNSGGAGIDNESAQMLINNSTFFQNTAGNGGAGGIYNFGVAGTIIMQSVTLSSNFAGAGGGGAIRNDAGSTMNLGHTIVIGNSTMDSVSPNITNSAILNTLGFNLIGNTNGAAGVVFAASDLINVADALLGPLTDNGGPIPTLLPGLGSLAIDAGTNIALFTTDQRGFARLSGSAMDIGAVETDYAATALAGTTPQSAQTNTAYANNLAVRVTEAGRNLSGIDVAFSAPNSGPSGSFPGGLLNINALTDASGVADPGIFTANGIVGAFSATAVVSNLPPVLFSLTNTEFVVIPPASGPYNSGDFANDGSTDVLAFRKKTLTLLNIVSNQLANQTTLDVPGKGKVVAANRVGNANFVAFKAGKKITVSAYTASSNIVKISDVAVGIKLPKTAGKIKASGDLNQDNAVDLITSKKQKVFALTGPTFANPTEIPIPLVGNKLPGKVVGAFTTTGSNWVLVFQKGKSVPAAFEVAISTNGVTVTNAVAVSAISKIRGMSGATPITKGKKSIIVGSLTIDTKANKVGKPVGPK